MRHHHPSLTSVFIRICSLYLLFFKDSTKCLRCFSPLVVPSSFLFFFLVYVFLPSSLGTSPFLLLSVPLKDSGWLQMKSELQSGVKEMTAHSSLIIPPLAAEPRAHVTHRRLTSILILKTWPRGLRAQFVQFIQFSRTFRVISH